MIYATLIIFAVLKKKENSKTGGGFPEVGQHRRDKSIETICRPEGVICGSISPNLKNRASKNFKNKFTLFLFKYFSF